MNNLVITAPSNDDYAPFYATYVSKVDYKDLLLGLAEFHDQTQAFLGRLSAEKAEFRYQEGKWSIKEVIGHLIDAERVFNYRALRFARHDKTELSGYDENFWAANSNAHQRNFDDLLKEFYFVRQATIELFNSFDEKMLNNEGVANGNKITVRALGFIILGHEIHHLQVLRERYF
jgi:hypothetical protein